MNARLRLPLLLLALGCVSAASAAYRRGELLWKTDFTAAELPALNGTNGTFRAGVNWSPADGRTGDGCFHVKNQAGRPGHMCGVRLDSSRVNGFVFIEADVKGVDLAPGPQPFNGPKIMFPNVKGNKRGYPQLPSEYGSFDWKTWVMIQNFPVDLDALSLVVGLECAPGEFWVDAVRIYRAVEIPDEANPVAPPNPRAAALPRGAFAGHPSPAARRGVMSGSDLSEEAFRTLEDWGANLIRYQIGIRTKECPDDAAWFAKLDRHLDDMEKVLARCRAHGLQLVVDLHGGPGTKQTKHASNVLPEGYDTANLRKAWRRIATRFKEDPAIYGYDILNEPACSLATWDRVFREVTAEIRTIDRKTPVITETEKFFYPDENVIYSPHYYSPHTLTHMGIGTGMAVVRWRYNDWINGEFWNKERIREALAPYIAFQQAHPGARIYIGEFSCILWARGAAEYINDCIELFDEYGWDWTYHAFREWAAWDVEYDHDADYTVDHVHKATAPTDRWRALVKGLRNNRTRK